MFQIKAKNGNVLNIEDVEHAKRALADGHEVSAFDPDSKDKPVKWDPEAEASESDSSSK